MDEEDLSQELRSLLFRADKLSKDLKALSEEPPLDYQAGEESSWNDADSSPEYIRAIMQRYVASESGDDDPVLPERATEARAGDTSSKARQELPMHPDLTFEDELRLRVRNRGQPNYWHMPFRRRLLEQVAAEIGGGAPGGGAPPGWASLPQNLADPANFAPTGDIYSYFRRRPLAPIAPHNGPLMHESTRAMGGHIRPF